MCERKRFIETAYRCRECDHLANMTEVQMKLGRCPNCGGKRLMEDGSLRVTYEAASLDHRGRPDYWRLVQAERDGKRLYAEQ